jgi:hypothetical protein
MSACACMYAACASAGRCLAMTNGVDTRRAVANADFCRYGVCKPGEPHVPGCVEYTDAERAAAPGHADSAGHINDVEAA